MSQDKRYQNPRHLCFSLLEHFETAQRQSSTSSYISDDCKVLYIETVIEVDKPVFYERSTDTSTVTHTEYHHIPQGKYNMTDESNNHHATDSTDDELPEPPLDSTNHLKQNADSGIEFDQNSSSSTIYNHRTVDDRYLFPQTNGAFDETSQPTLIRRMHQQRTRNPDDEDRIPITRVRFHPPNTFWDRLNRYCLFPLLIGLLILFSLLAVYLFTLDLCSRSKLIRSVCHEILHIDRGRPTI